jgi:hypothetical protein
MRRQKKRKRKVDAAKKEALMASFYVHWNTIVRRLRIHRSECGACKGGAGMHEGKIAAGRGETYDWVPALTYADALAVVTNLKRAHPQLDRPGARIDCGLCHPARNAC